MQGVSDAFGAPDHTRSWNVCPSSHVPQIAALLNHPAHPLHQLLQPLPRRRQIRARRPEPVRQPRVHVAPRLQARVLEQPLEQQRLVAARVQAADGEVSLLGDAGVRVEEQRREALVPGRRAVYACSWLVPIPAQVAGNRRGRYRGSSRWTLSSSQAPR